MAWGRKAARIADLEASNAILRQQLADTRNERDAWAWESQRAAAQRNRLHDAHRTPAADTAALTAAKAARRRAELRAGRYQAAWLSARRRAGRQRADLADQRAVIAQLTTQLLDAMGYPPAARDLLNGPRPAATKPKEAPR